MPNRSWRDSKLLCKSGVTPITLGKFSHLQDRLFCKNGPTMPFSPRHPFRFCLRTRAALSIHVPRIIKGRAQEQMTRPHTTTIIALVADQRSFRDRTKVHLPRNAVSLQHPTAATSPTDLSVSASSYRGGPFPAPRTSPDMVPETLLKRNAARSTESHMFLSATKGREPQRTPAPSPYCRPKSLLGLSLKSAYRNHAPVRSRTQASPRPSPSS